MTKHDNFSADMRSNVLGVGINPLNLDSATDTILEASNKPGFQGYVTVTGVHGVMESQRDPELKSIHRKSFLSVPDGMPMVWVGKLNGFENISRVYGPDLMLQIISRSTHSGLKHYLFGGGDGVVEKLSRKLSEKHQNLQIAGIHTPPFRPLTNQEMQSLADEIQRLKPHLFWVGLSTPKQERFMHEFLAQYPGLTKDWDHGLVMLGVGAAFDFHAGLLDQAPHWMQQAGLEWLYRLYKEPKRLWRRYLYNNPLFIWNILRQLTNPRAPSTLPPAGKSID